jgi:hypothetical protein
MNSGTKKIVNNSFLFLMAELDEIKKEAVRLEIESKQNNGKSEERDIHKN